MPTPLPPNPPNRAYGTTPAAERWQQPDPITVEVELPAPAATEASPAPVVEASTDTPEPESDSESPKDAALTPTADQRSPIEDTAAVTARPTWTP